MNNKQYRKQRVILQPVITQKTYFLADKRCYAFDVRSSANKYEIANEFKELFKAKVLKINTVTTKSHQKRTKTGTKRKADGKRAYIYTDVTLDIFPQNNSIQSD